MLAEYLRRYCGIIAEYAEFLRLSSGVLFLYLPLHRQTVQDTSRWGSFPSAWRCYDLYFFIFGVYHLVLPPCSLFLFWIHGTLAKKFPAQLGMLPTCHCPRGFSRLMFHPCRDLRHPNPRLLCALKSPKKWLHKKGHLIAAGSSITGLF